MNPTEIEGEIVAEESQYLPAVRPEASPTLFGTDDPSEVIVRATAMAKPLADVVRKQKLTTNIQGREHVRVEGWTLLGSMLGVFPILTWTRKLEDGWEARVEARTRDGALVGAAEAQCLYSEKTWKSRDDYALRSMAQTRATSKALRQPLGFVMQLAGFDPTPAEEMPHGATSRRAADPHGLQSARADAVSRADRMRERIFVLASEADAKRDVAAGTSAAEIAAKLGEKPDEAALENIGGDVAEWIAEGCACPFNEYTSVPF